MIPLDTFQLTCKLSPEFIPKTTLYYAQVLRSWFDFYSVPPSSKHISREILWNNKFILIDKKPIYQAYKNWIQKGVKYLSDIVGRDGELLSVAQFEAKFGIHINIMMYNSLISAIPGQWKNHLRTECGHIIPPNPIGNNNADDRQMGHIIIDKTVYTLDNLSSNKIYWALVNRIKNQPTALDKWIDDFPFLNDQDFKRFFRLPYTTSKSTKLQTFQYTIINRVIPCNENLHRWQLRENPICDNCCEIQTTKHLFFGCTVIKTFWDNIQAWVKSNLQITIPLSVTDILFGIPTYDDQLLFSLNFIILQGKWYIFRNKLSGKIVSCPAFISELQEIIRQEILADIPNQNVHATAEHHRKWDILRELIE